MNQRMHMFVTLRFTVFFLGFTGAVWGIVACGGPQATPCTSVADCIGEQVCHEKQCKERCKNNADCLGSEYCDANSGVCKTGTPPLTESTPDSGNPTDNQPPTPDVITTPDTTTNLCGNGNIDNGEACDGANLNNQTCQSQGFASGNLGCTQNCQFDTSGCQASSDCGNGKIDNGEECDGTNLNNQTCTSRGFTDGNLGCTAGCRFDESGCTKTTPPQCNDGKAEGTEECDGTDLKSQTCQGLGFTGGTLKCSNQCKLDTSGCTGTPPKKKFGQTCENPGDCDTGLICIVTKTGDAKGYCTATCSSTQPCPTTPPGAGCILQTSSSEICGWSCTPGGNECPPELSCVAFGNDYICGAGTPATPAKCNDGKLDSTEECEGTNLNNQTCQSQGFTGGTLKCSSQCKFDTSGCTGPPTVPGFGTACPNGTCSGNLVCVNFGQGQSYCTAYCSSTQPCPASTPPASCNIQLQGGGEVCGWQTSSGAPPVCGNGVIDPGEDCDKTSFGATCKGIGYTGGTLKCTSQCQYDTSSCTGTSNCNLPPRHCTSGCSTVVQFLPTNGTGYRALHGTKYSWAKKSTMIYIQYAAASVACVYPGTNPIGLGDMSMQNGGTPAETNGQLRHPQGTHVNGNDVDIAYCQINTPNNDLRPVCEHIVNGQDQYHCVKAPHLLDVTKSAFFIAKLLESNSVRVIGVDGKIGPLIKTAMQSLVQSGLITQTILDRFNQGSVTWEETDQQRGWFLFHHHHLHVSFR